MGRRRKHAPKRGSLAFLPRGRAASPIGKIRHWPDYTGDKSILLGFAGFKAGMTHVYMIDDYERSPRYGSEKFVPVTVLEVPPAVVCGIRAYQSTNKGLTSLTEAWMKNPPGDLYRLLTLPDDFDTDEKLKTIESVIDTINEFRAILCIQPRQASISQKKPVLMEVKVDGGTIKAQFEYLKDKLGEEIHSSEIFNNGQFVDIIAVTKGKGFQGPVKRWGVKKLHHKSNKTVRGVGSIGPWNPHYVMYSVPRAGQMGFHQRTEYNKRIVNMGSNIEDVNVAGGFLRYGQVRSDYILLSGSVPGPAGRLIKLRYPTRKSKKSSDSPPRITHIELKNLEAA